MKSTLRVLTLVLVLVWTKADEKEGQCESLKKTISPEQLPQVQGSWVLVWGVTHGPRGRALIPHATSSHLDLQLLDNSTLSYEEKNFYRGLRWNCSHLLLNATVDSSDKDFFSLTADGGIMDFESTTSHDFPDKITITFFPSCEHCLHMLYGSSGSGNYFLIYRREGHATQVKLTDLPLFRKQAECWDFPSEPAFIYDGHSHFCYM